MSIAYRVVGSGAIDLVFQPGFMSHLAVVASRLTRHKPGL